MPSPSSEITIDIYLCSLASRYLNKKYTSQNYICAAKIYIYPVKSSICAAKVLYVQQKVIYAAVKVICAARKVICAG